MENIEKPEPDIYNPFAPENLRLSQDVLDGLAASARLGHNPSGETVRSGFFPVPPSDDYQYQAALITHHEEKGARYLVHPVFLKEKRKLV